MRKTAIALGALLLLAGCAMPSTVVKTPDTRPSLAFQGAPAGSLLYLDGQKIGEANAYDGQPGVLLVEPGTHEVEIRAVDGVVVYQQRIFVESELKTIKVH